MTELNLGFQRNGEKKKGEGERDPSKRIGIFKKNRSTGVEPD